MIGFTRQYFVSSYSRPLAKFFIADLPLNDLINQITHGKNTLAQEFLSRN